MCTAHFCRDTGCTDAIALYNRVTEEEDGLPINVDRNSEEEGDDAGKSSKKRKAVSGILIVIIFCNVSFLAFGITWLYPVFCFRFWNNLVIPYVHTSNLNPKPQSLRGYCTPNQFCGCLYIFLKNYNRLLQVRYVSYR